MLFNKSIPQQNKYIYYILYIHIEIHKTNSECPFESTLVLAADCTKDRYRLEKPPVDGVCLHEFRVTENVLYALHGIVHVVKQP